MQRLVGATKLHIWQFLRGKKVCEDDRSQKLRDAWDRTMQAFMEERERERAA